MKRAQRKNNKKRVHNKKSRRPQSYNEAVPLGPGNVRVPKSMALPTTMTAWLTYDDTTILRTNVANTVLGWRYRMNSAFDPDPLLGSGALPGFAEYATMFIAYRVINFEYSISISNNELFPMPIFVVPLNTDPGANPLNGYTLAANPKGYTRIISSVGGPGATIRGRVNLANFYGLRGYNLDDDLNAPINGSPLALLYLLVGAFAPSPFTSSGLITRVRLRYQVVFNRRRNLAA